MAGARDDQTALPPDSGDPEGDLIRVANEFAEVTIRKVLTRNGARLEIASPRKGHVIQLCPLELEALTAASKDALSELLAHPAAPEDPDDPGDPDDRGDPA